MKKYDLIVIGGGPGGYVAAIRAKQNGIGSVLCVDANPKLGGTCLNIGCIPSKILLNISHQYHTMKSAKEIGISCGSLSVEMPQVMQKKQETISSLASGIKALFAKNKVEFIQGHATFTDDQTITVNGETFNGEKFIIATGSSAATISDAVIDEERILSSSGALSLNFVPKKMIVIGGGYIGLELGSVYAALGSEVTVVEYAPEILPNADSDISSAVKKSMEREYGMKFILGVKVKSISRNKNQGHIIYSDKEDKETELQADVVLISVGRKPNTAGLMVEKAHINLDSRGYVLVNQQLQTSNPKVHAIGDVIGGAMLAHKAEEEGVAVANVIAGRYFHVPYDLIPGIVYIHPEVASVGKTEKQLKAEGIDYKIGKFPFMANSRAKCTGQIDGFVKIITCSKSDRILGAHIFGPEAGNLIHQLAIAMQFGASAEDVALLCHGHPTFNEAIKEAALNVEKMSIHI